MPERDPDDVQLEASAELLNPMDTLLQRAYLSLHRRASPPIAKAGSARSEGKRREVAASEHRCRVSLSLHQRAVAAALAGPQNAPVGSLKRVAVVDDDPSLCRSFSRLLRLAGYEPSAFLSAEDFLAEGERGGFACLLLDIQLGGMSGIELQRAMSARGDPTALIFVTAHDEPALRAEAMQAGCAGFFSKSDDGERILAAVKRAVHD